MGWCAENPGLKSVPPLRFPAVKRQFMVKLKSPYIFNWGFEGRKLAKIIGKSARLRQKFWAFTIAALTMIGA
jgi:hypothetical protein